MTRSMGSTTSSTAPLNAVAGERTLADIYKVIGVGWYQWRLFFIAGLGCMSDAIEVGVITFMESEAEKVWEIRGYAKNVLALAVFIGEFAGCFIWGPLADRIGRKKTFIISNVFLLLFGCLSAAAPNFWCLVVLRFIVGISIGGIVVPFDCLLESVAEEHQAMFAYAIQFWWTAGTLFVTGLAALVLPTTWGGWRIFVLLASSPILLVCCAGFFVDESPAWLQDVGCTDEALQVLQRVARTNGKDITGLTLVPYEREADPSMRELFSPSLRRRTLSLSLIWVLGLFGYYGASLANGFIFDDKGSINYGEVIFASSGEVAGVVVNLLLNRCMGGMWVLGICYQIATLGCLGLVFTALLPADNAAPKVLVAFLAFVLRLGAMGGSSAVWAVTPPAYPTHVRATAHSLLFGAGRIGGLLATLWPSSTPIPVIMVTYAIANCICGMAGFCEVRSLERKGVFESLASDLNATDIDRRSRSVAYRSTRLSTGTTGRPSLFGSARVSVGAKGRPSLPMGPSPRETSG